MSLSLIRYDCAVATRLIAVPDRARSRAGSNDVLSAEDSSTTHPPHDHPSPPPSVLTLDARYARTEYRCVRMPADDRDLISILSRTINARGR